jgi:hypothetical protein
MRGCRTGEAKEKRDLSAPLTSLCEDVKGNSRGKALGEGKALLSKGCTRAHRLQTKEATTCVYNTSGGLDIWREKKKKTRYNGWIRTKRRIYIYI